MFHLLSETQKYYLYRFVLTFCCGVSLASAFAPANEPLFALASLIVMFYLVGTTENIKHVAMWGLSFVFCWFVIGIN